MAAGAAPALIVPVGVAEEVWIAVALLHRENASREDFSIEEILERVKKESLHPALRPGVRTHIASHCVANRAVNPARLRMLYATARDRRRLYRAGDPVEEGRTGRIVPAPEDIPKRYHPLIDWYQKEYAKAGAGQNEWLSGFFAMRGLMKGVWKDEDPDEYVRKLRENWE
jgi:hypothetical protein